MVFENARMIWHGEDFAENDYAEFCETLSYSGGNAKLLVSVSGDYALFINGKFAESNQFADFPHYKVYDEIDITGHLKNGENVICILAWYFGESGMRYNTPNPGISYEIEIDGKVALASSEKSLSRKSKAYKSGEMKRISYQFGYSFLYDSMKEDGWLLGCGTGFGASKEMEKPTEFHIRPTKKLTLKELETGKITETENGYIIDLGREIVGLPSFSIASDTEQNINVAYGELLEAGHVKRFVDDRDFSFDYVAKQGDNEFTSYMLRFACRYIEITAENPFTLNFAGIIPQVYEVAEKKIDLSDELDKKIYEISINTLKLCMMEHYVDCPWREQCLYAFDSRNQILSGYSAFCGGNLEYARANLLLMSKDNREDGLLSICFPSKDDLTIPSFSLYFILSVLEYLEESGDKTLGFEVFEKLESILSVFKNRIESGLVNRFEGFGYWNFYDWSNLGYIRRGQGKNEPDFLINAIFVIGLNAFDKICGILEKENAFSGLSEEIKAKLNQKYYDSETGTYFIQEKSEPRTELANSLAIVSGVADNEKAEKICGMLASGELEPCSLSMKVFKYDALIRVNKEKYKESILDEIRKTYKVMLDADSTTVWETAEGSVAFENAGSLCHGWSAVPVHYYHLLK